MPRPSEPAERQRPANALQSTSGIAGERAANRPSSVSDFRRDACWLVALIVLLGLQLWFPRIESGIRHNSYSAGLVGKKAFRHLGESLGRDVSVNHRPIERLVSALYDDDFDDWDVVVIAGPVRSPGDAEWAALLDWVADGGSLLYAAREDAFRNDGPALVVDHGHVHFEIESPDVSGDNADDYGTEEDDEVEVEPAASESGRGGTPGRNGDSKSTQGAEADIDGASSKPNSNDDQDDERIATAGSGGRSVGIQTSLVSSSNLAWRTTGRIKVDDAEVLVQTRTGDVQAVRIEHGYGRIVILASDFPFCNSSLALNDNAVLAWRLLEAAGDTSGYIIDESLNDSGTPRLVGLLLEPILRPLTLMLLVLMLLYAWWNHHRFGPLLPEVVRSRQSIIEHTNAVGTLHYLAKHGQVAVRSSLQQLLSQLRVQHVSGRDDRLVHYIAGRIGQSAETVQATLDEARNAADAARVDRRTAARIVRSLCEMRRGITGQRP